MITTSKQVLARTLMILLTGIMTAVSPTQAQPAGTSNFYNNIKNYNLSALWRADRLKLLSLKQTEPFPEPYGVLGKNYQRFYIHYTSVTKDPANPYRYQVQGKTRIGNQIRLFTGNITITQAGIYKPGANNPYSPGSYKGYKRGQVICRVEISEATSAPGSGVIKGELVSSFCINAQNQLLYDTLDFGEDGYQNNEFAGSRIPYNSSAVQKLQWGDYNLNNTPFGDPGGITVPPEYEKYGWQSFVNAQNYDHQPASKAAIAEEKRQWWK